MAQGYGHWIYDMEKGLQEEGGELHPFSKSMDPLDKMDELEKEVESLRGEIKHLVRACTEQKSNPSSKSLLKPRDIPVLELDHLQGVEGEGRLKVFFSQVEECSPHERERQKIVMTRVDTKLAVYIQSVWAKQEDLSWKEFKSHLIKELTDPSYSKILESLNDLQYHYSKDPVSFVTLLKCRMALLEVKSGEEETPDIRKLIKTKILKGMPKDCRERLDMYMDKSIPLKRFMEKIEVERIIAMTRSKEEVYAVRSETPMPTQTAVTTSTPTAGPHGKNPDKVGYETGSEPKVQKSRTWVNQRRYCPYCRSNTHVRANCWRNPPPGSCYDCLRMNCKRGAPDCPGREVKTR